MCSLKQPKTVFVFSNYFRIFSSFLIPAWIFVLCFAASIPPFGEGTLAVVCSTPITGADVTVSYAINGLPRGKAGIQFAAGNHLISGRYSRTSIAQHEEKNFTIRKKENNESRYAISYSVKTAYPAPAAIPSTISTNSASSASSSSNRELASTVERGLPSTPPVATKDAESDVGTQKNAEESKNSTSPKSALYKVQLNVFNDTHYTWYLDECGIDAGVWHTDPPRELKSFGKHSWLSLPTDAGTLGYAKYHCENRSTLLFFTKWTCKPSMKPQVDALVSGPQPRALDCEYRLSHTHDCIILDVTIFAEGSFRKASTTPIPVSRVAPGVVSSVSLKMFRLPIEVVVDKESRGSQVPWIIETLFSWLISEHVATVNLFGLHGRYSEIKALKAHFESGDAMRLYEAQGNKWLNKFLPASVLAILKLFLRELPVPLVPPLSIPFLLKLEDSESASKYIDDGNFPLLTELASPKSPQKPLSYTKQQQSSTSSTSLSTQISTPKRANSLELSESVHAPNAAYTLDLIAKFLRTLPVVNAVTLLYILKSLSALWKASGSVHTVDSITVIFAPLVAPDKPDGSLKCTLPVISAFSTLIQYVDQLPVAK